MELVQAIVGTFLATAVAAGLSTYLVIHWTRGRKRLGYEVKFAGPIVTFEPQAGDPIQIAVRNNVLGEVKQKTDTLLGVTSDDSSVVGYSVVGKVYGFRIGLRNCGNAVIEDQEVSVELDDSAKVVQIEPEINVPSLKGRLTACVGVGSDSARFRLSFLNEKEEIVVGVRSVENSSNSCEVFAAAPGLECYDMGARRRWWAKIAFGISLPFLVIGSAMSLSTPYLEGSAEFGGVSVVGWIGLAVLVIGAAILIRGTSLLTEFRATRAAKH